jgi:hypothetical protein
MEKLWLIKCECLVQELSFLISLPKVLIKKNFKKRRYWFVISFSHISCRRCYHRVRSREDTQFKGSGRSVTCRIRAHLASIKGTFSSTSRAIVNMVLCRQVDALRSLTPLGTQASGASVFLAPVASSWLLHLSFLNG